MSKRNAHAVAARQREAGAHEEATPITCAECGKVFEAAKAFLALEPFRYRYLDYDQQRAIDGVRKAVEALEEARDE